MSRGDHRVVVLAVRERQDLALEFRQRDCGPLARSTSDACSVIFVRVRDIAYVRQNRRFMYVFICLSIFVYFSIRIRRHYYGSFHRFS